MSSDLRLIVLGGGSRSSAYRQILADLAGRRVTTVGADEHVAAGACVQAAAVLAQKDPHEIAQAWGLGRPAGVVRYGSIRWTGGRLSWPASRM